MLLLLLPETVGVVLWWGLSTGKVYKVLQQWSVT